MNHSSTKPSCAGREWLLPGIALLFGGAWMVAVVFGHGFDWYRQALVMPLAVLACLLLAVDLGRGRGGLRASFMGTVLLVLGYFFWRMATSPVWDLARLDLWLGLLFLLGLAVGGQVVASRRAQLVLWTVLALVFLGHFLAAQIQVHVDPAFAVGRPDRSDQAGASGLFWHRNYLAGALELFLPVLLAAVLLGKNRVWRMVAVVALLAGLYLAYQTQSRAGILAVASGLMAVAACWGFLRVRRWSLQAQFAAGVAGVLALVGVVFLVVMMVSAVSEQRNRDADLEEAGARDARLALAGAAIGQWEEAPVLGTGSRTFSYLVVRNWDRVQMKNWLGNPVMVHNDYLQTMAEYGLVGLGLLLVLLVVALVVVAASRRRSDSGGEWRLGLVGGLAAVSVHGLFDFSLHILPNIMLLGLICGLAVGSCDGATGRGGWNARWQAVLQLVLGAVLFLVGLGGVRVLPDWIAWERQARSLPRTFDTDDLAPLRGLLEKAPDYEVAREYGNLLLVASRREDGGAEQFLPEAIRALEIAVERHPYDAESLGNLGLAYHQAGRLAEATPLHVRAVEAASRRENKYGALAALSHNLSGRGEERWQAREPEKALGYFLRASEYLERSYNLNFRVGRGELYRQQKAWLEGRIELLQGAGITPDYPDDVPTVEEATE